jgi:hypothetical protein
MRRHDWLRYTLSASLLMTGLGSCSQSMPEISDNCITNAAGIGEDPLSGQELDAGQLSLIFVGGPSDITDNIGAFLLESGIQATFFANGRHIPQHKAILDQVVSSGHLAGNYGYSGQNLAESRNPRTEVRATDELLTPFIKGNMFLFSPPQFVYRERLGALLNTSGLNKYVGPITPLAGANNDSFLFDFECWQQNLDVGSCVQNYLEEIRRVERGIVAFSDASEQTLELLRQILPVLQNEDFSFIRLDSIPSVAFSLRAAGASPGSDSRNETCNDYD